MLRQDKTSVGTLLMKQPRTTQSNPAPLIELSMLNNVTIETADNRVQGVGYFLIKKLILSVPPQNIRLFSLKEAILFYWNLGFRPVLQGEATSYAREIERAKAKKRAPELRSVWMALSPTFSRAWEEIAASEELLQLSLKGRQTPIYLIQTYLMSEERQSDSMVAKLFKFFTRIK
jgi:hypothetical protein